MRISLVGARRLDWDELLFEIPVAGRDFEVLLLVETLEMYRGPMGSLTRVADDLHVRPEYFVRRWTGKPIGIAMPPDELEPVRVSLTRHTAVLLPDASIVITADITREPLYRLCAPGDTILASPDFARIASE